MILPMTESRQKIAPVPFVKEALAPSELVEVHLRQLAELRYELGPHQFLLGKLDQSIQVLYVARTQERIRKHGRQGGRDGHRQPKGDAFGIQTVKHIQQRDIGLGDGFKKPILLHIAGLFRVAYKRKMGMENQPEISFGHRAPSVPSSDGLLGELRASDPRRDPRPSHGSRGVFHRGREIGGGRCRRD